MNEHEEVILGGYRLSEILRRVRRTADMSQRELAKYARVGKSTVAAIEAATISPAIGTLQRLLNAANYQLVVVDATGWLVLPLQVWQGITDGAGNRYPAHLDVVLDPEYGQWWADVYGLTSPPETYHRNRADRDYRRRLSVREVRVAQNRNKPKPAPPGRRRPLDAAG